MRQVFHSDAQESGSEVDQHWLRTRESRTELSPGSLSPSLGFEFLYLCNGRIESRNPDPTFMSFFVKLTPNPSHSAWPGGIPTYLPVAHCPPPPSTFHSWRSKGVSRAASWKRKWNHRKWNQVGCDYEWMSIWGQEADDWGRTWGPGAALEGRAAWGTPEALSPEKLMSPHMLFIIQNINTEQQSRCQESNVVLNF